MQSFIEKGEVTGTASTLHQYVAWTPFHNHVQETSSARSALRQSIMVQDPPAHIPAFLPAFPDKHT